MSTLLVILVCSLCLVIDVALTIYRRRLEAKAKRRDFLIRCMLNTMDKRYRYAVELMTNPSDKKAQTMFEKTGEHYLLLQQEYDEQFK